MQAYSRKQLHSQMHHFLQLVFAVCCVFFLGVKFEVILNMAYPPRLVIKEIAFEQTVLSVLLWSSKALMIHDIKIKPCNPENANFRHFLMGFLYSGGQVLKSAKAVDWLNQSTGILSHCSPFAWCIQISDRTMVSRSHCHQVVPAIALPTRPLSFFPFCIVEIIFCNVIHFILPVSQLDFGGGGVFGLDRFSAASDAVRNANLYIQCVLSPSFTELESRWWK